MPVVIGAKPESNFRNPIGLLIDCHRRIERFLGVLVQLGREPRQTPLAQAERASLETALRYFRESAPKHTADEEESLFPRLRALDRPEVRGVLADIESLQGDHVRADAMHAEVDRLGEAWLANGSLPPEDAARFAALVAELADLYGDHIAVEERDLFPVAAAVLEAAQRHAIGDEMADRRGLPRGA